MTLFYSPEQIELIRQQLDIKPLAPEGYLSTGGIAKSLGLGYNTVAKCIDILGDTLGEVRKYRSTARATLHYSPEQIRQIVERIQQNPRVKLGEAALGLLREDT